MLGQRSVKCSGAQYRDHLATSFMTDRLGYRRFRHPADAVAFQDERKRAVESSPERASSSQLPATELLLHAIAAARTVGIVSGVTQLTAGERDLAALHVLVILGPQRASDLANMFRISRAAAAD